ncbi:hypothetical protein [Nostoc sp. CCY 9925]|uniref:hypothetical protein n=1 Tax=Nostoc sp. CCY 9925 TaxID=3103865 RepID=UPI0039C69BEC
MLTLSLAYLAEARCYLELEEHETALRRFQEGARIIRSRIQKYVNLLLTSNPGAYLQPEFKGQIHLRRITRIYQWIDPITQDYEKTNRKGRKGHKEIRISESFCVSPKLFSILSLRPLRLCGS